MDFTYASTISGEELRLLAPTAITRFALHFAISTVPRRTSPRYTAVSYVWGSGSASELIYLNGQAFRVRPNLWSCLYYLGLDARSRGGFGGGGCTELWVDAICIDQSNAAERNAQIRRMNRTYQGAAYVSVWLGLSTIPSHLVQNGPEPVKTIDVEPFEWCNHIADLANRPYWSRVWVIQEFLLGRHVFLYCSNSRMNWQDFWSMLCREAGVAEFDSGFGTAESSAQAHSYRALPLVMNRHVDKFPTYLQPLYDLLIRHQRAECHDPRDRVFALLGLVTPTEWGLLERFFPDYSMPEEHVCVIALAHIVQSYTSISVPTITPDSEELFLGLGVKTRAKRQRLLRWANEFDYLGDWDFGQATRHLSWLEEVNGRSYDGISDEEGGYHHDKTRDRSSRLGKLGLLVIIDRSGCRWVPVAVLNNNQMI